MSAGDHGIPPAPAIEGAEHLHSGKVRDLYRLPGGELLMVASDRISAYDFVLETTIPDKGAVLTQMSLWWFEQLADLVPEPRAVRSTYRRRSTGRAVVCESLAMFPVECVARGYLTGSGLRGVRATPARSAASRCPPGWSTAAGCPSRSSPRRPRPTLGDHDENVSYDAVVGRGRRRGRRAAARPDPRGLRPRRGDRPRARHHPGRHQARVRRRAPDGDDRAGRRGAHPRLVPVLAGRRVAAGPRPAVVRQAVVRDWLTSPASGWDRTSGRGPAAAARRGRRADPGALRRGLRAADRPHVHERPARGDPREAPGGRPQRGRGAAQRAQGHLGLRVARPAETTSARCAA